MKSLEKKKILMNKFAERKKKHLHSCKKIITFKELNIPLEKETIEWYEKHRNGGIDID